MLRRITVMVASLALVILVSSLLFSQGCGKGGGSTSEDSPAPGTDRISLSLNVSESEAGPVAVISAAGSNIYQCSLRLQFDPAVVKPVSAQKGDLFQGEHFFFAPTDKEGFVPIGATLRWKGQETRSSGTVATIGFERLSDGDPNFQILDDSAYLIVRDDAETRLPVVITGGGQ